MLRVIIVDDESAARRGLRFLLKEHADVEILGEAGSVAEAKALLGMGTPDLVFLDVEMPRAGGFSLGGALAAETEIIFVTAHAEHAAKAFDIKALDYLLKPLRPERLAEALTRARDFFSKRDTATAGKSLMLRDGRKEVMVGTEDIVALEAEGDYTRFHFREAASMLAGGNIGAFQEELPEESFARLSRSLMVNLDRIASLEVLSRDESRLHLQGLKNPLCLRRAATRKLRALLAER